MQGMGGVSSSIGGDVSSMLRNPAGLGFFNRSEVTFSPSLNFHNSETKFAGGSDRDFKTNLNLGTLGFVLNNSKRNPEGSWKGGSFGIGITRINDFHLKGSINNFESDYSFINSAVDYLNDDGPIGLADLALETTLVYYYEDEDFYDQDVLPIDDDTPINIPVSNRQSERIETSGAAYQTSLGYGGNFGDKFYVGASIGFTSLNYIIERRYSEVPLSSDSFLNEFTLVDDRRIEGSGINLSLGAIYRPFSQLTIGLAYASPTYYTLEENINSDLTAYFRDEEPSYSNLPRAYNFDLKTPSVFNTGVTYLFGKNGLITADIEYIDYSNNQYSTDNGDLEGENDFIASNFNDVLNYKIGGEYRLNIFRVRAGYAYFGDPSEELDEVDKSRQSFTIGAGIRLPNYFIDLAVVNTMYETNFISLYEGGYPTAFDNNSTRAMVTVGFNF